MTDKIEELRSENEELRVELEHYKKMVCGYENVLKLNEKELENAEKIIKMYESVIELARNELKLTRETSEARERVSSLSREELMDALNKIKGLEEQNRKIKEQLSCQ